MQGNKMSETAQAVAAVRAGHFKFDDPPRVFEDPLAGDLIISPFLRLLANNRVMYQISRKLLYRGSEPWFGLFLGRARWNEEELEKAIAVGTSQYVILGAGLDSFAWRRPDWAAGVRVYEVDHPATQDSKRRRISKLKLEAPNDLEFVPCDFERETVADALTRSSYAPDRPAFYSWMGTTMYLSREAVLQTLSAISALAAPGSELLFDYCIPDRLHDQVDHRLIRKWRRDISRLGEPQLSSFDPQGFSEEVGTFGFEMLENLSPGELDARYLGGQPELRTISLAFLAHLRLR